MRNLITSRTIHSYLIPLFVTLIATGSALTVRAQAADNPVATVNGRKITRQEVDSTVLVQLLPLEQQIYALRKAALENRISRILLEDEAKRRGISVDELIRLTTAGAVEIPSAQIEQAYLENAPAFAQMSPDEAKERIRMDLESQARMRNYRSTISKLREEARIEIYLNAPSLPYETLDRDAPSIGSKSAPVTIIEFSDFQCPYCRESFPVVKQVIDHFGADVRFVFKHLPLSIHKQALPAARAAFCGGQQGQFWGFHDALFSIDELTSPKLESIAARLNLDLPRFRLCLQSDESRNAVMKDSLEARRLGIDGTPAFIINGKPYRGVLDFDNFKSIVEQELNSSQSHKK